MLDRIKRIWCDTNSQFRVIQRKKEDLTEELCEKTGLNSPIGKKVKKFFSFLIKWEKRKNNKFDY